MTETNESSIPDQIISITRSFENISLQKIREDLVILINELINKDFSALLQLLYRIDVDEKKIQLSLEQGADKDSAQIIADLIIERQLKKIASRKQFSNNTDEECNEEKW